MIKIEYDSFGVHLIFDFTFPNFFQKCEKSRKQNGKMSIEHNIQHEVSNKSTINDDTLKGLSTDNTASGATICAIH